MIKDFMAIDPPVSAPAFWSASETPPPPETGCSAGPPSPGPHPNNVMLVEDNRADVIMVREAIKAHSLAIDLLVVDDGAKAVQYVEEFESGARPCPDLILLDLNLPKLDGKEVLKHIRQSKSCADTPVVIISSSDAPAERKALDLAGASFYFHKPSSYNAFLKLGELIGSILSGRNRPRH